jgi:penicillin-binding protein 2
MDLAHALEQSCDTYFYKLAMDFYYAPGSRLQNWSRKFGLGSPTGIDLPGEESGLVPTPEWRKKTFTGQQAIWGPGQNVNLSIGQGDLLVTPLQMTMVYGAIANGGTLHEPRLATAVEDTGGNEILDIDRGKSRKLPIEDEWMQSVRNGIYLASNGGNGTASSVFQTFAVPVSGKTGTGEKPPLDDIAWYCGYAPAQAPVIAACAIVEQGAHGGSAAAPVLLRMFQSYLDAEGGSVRSSGRSD